MNRGIIQDHSFWEIREGHDANFWNDSWQHMPNIISNIDIKGSWTIAKEMRIIKLHQFWKEVKNYEEFYEWNPQEWRNKILPKTPTRLWRPFRNGAFVSKEDPIN